MIYGYARVSTDGQSVDAQVKQLRAAGVDQVFRETASGAGRSRAVAPRPRAARQGRRVDGDSPGPAGALDARPVEHARHDRDGRSRSHKTVALGGFVEECAG